MYILLRPLPIRPIFPSTSNTAPKSLHSAAESYRCRCLSCPHKDYSAACTPIACHTDSPTATATAIRIPHSRDHGPYLKNSSHTLSPTFDAVAPSCPTVALPLLLLPPPRRSHQDARRHSCKRPAPVCFDFWRQNSRAQTPRLQPRLALPSASVSAACHGSLGFPTAAAYPRVPMVVKMTVMIGGGGRHSRAVCVFPRAPGSSCPLLLGPGCSAAARVRLQKRSVVGVASPLLVVWRVAWRLRDSALDRRWWSDPGEPLLGTTHVHRQGE